jgi:hypothetical protein
MMSLRTAAQTALVVGVVTAALASPALASAARTFVSGGGSDGNTGANCPQGSPCRSFSAAYSVTSSGGEIIALDSAGYGTLTITGPVSIVGALIASVQVPANSTGITINTAGASDVVILKNLQINGGNAAQSTGISVMQGRMILQNSTVKLLTTGLSIAANTKSDVRATDIIGNGTAISTTGTGTNLTNTSIYGPTQVRVDGGSVSDNGTAFLMNAPGKDNFNNQNSTVLLFSNGGSATTDVTGNTTVVSCTGQTCTFVLTYQSPLTNSPNPN